MSYTYDRRKVADAGLESLVENYLASIAEKIGHSNAAATHAHVSGVKMKNGEVSAEIIARAGDQLHHFGVHLSLDGLQIIAILDYTSMGAQGEKGRSHSLAFNLPAKASPGHFISQVVDAAMEQYQGSAATLNVELRSARMRA